MAKTRSFIAVNLPQKIKQELGNLVENLKKDLFVCAHSHCPNAKSDLPAIRLRRSRWQAGATSVNARYLDAIKWVKPENFHLTLHFLGYLDEKQLEQVKSILQTSVFKTDIVLKIKQIGCFPNQNRPRVLFFKCEEKENNNLINMQQIIGKALKHIGIEIDNRVWQKHLTFARVKKPFVLPESSKKSTLKELFFQVKSIDLMKSELKRTGPIYSIIESFPLKSIC